MICKPVALRVLIVLTIGTFALMTMSYRQASYQQEGRGNPGNRSAAPGSDYYAPLTEKEKGDIRYIITTISGKSKFSLLFSQGSLNQAGNRVSNVHPLVFLGYVFSDPQLKQAAKNIDGMVWDRFSGDMAKSLALEANHGNVKKEHLNDFAKKIGVNETIFDQVAQSGRWKEFITIARDNMR